jgi:uncharacterized membrane protein YgdD (TMEM256/DUF423 family)
MQSRHWIALGAVWTAIGVALGAFGAHALKAELEAHGHVATWETASRYHLFHGLALCVLGLVARESRGTICGIAGALFAAGSLLFSGSLYWLALDGPRWLGPVTPLGGLALIIAWLLFAAAALRALRTGAT